MARSRPSTDVRVDVKDFTELFGKSSQVEPKLRAALRKRMRVAAMDAANDVKSAVQESSKDSGKGRHRGLRSGIASGIKVRVSTANSAKTVGITLVSSGSGLPADQKNLVRAYNKKSWRHPVFSHTEKARGLRGTLLRRKQAVWVTQAGNPYFEAVIDKSKDKITAAVLAAMEEATASLLKP